MNSIDNDFDENFDLTSNEDILSQEGILALNNNLMNLWIRVYYLRWWTEKVHTISPSWLREITEECHKYDYLLDWKTGNPTVKDDLRLTNKECTILWFILENYDGLDTFTLWELMDKANNPDCYHYIQEYHCFPV